jgi:2-C-methyl-D-erythritol 2,4-cyclodiphosphate synthase
MSLMALLVAPASSFVMAGAHSSSTKLASTAASAEDLLKPTYEVEPIGIRIGHGFDIHRMAPIADAGQPLIIGGVEITHTDQKVRLECIEQLSGARMSNTEPHLFLANSQWTDAEGKYVEKGGIYETQLGVVAHSDGDVIYHSIVDAIFGALTLPDIGQVFQDTDPRWRGCDSSKFMEHAYEVMAGYGYQIGNADVTLILERPKVASFKPAMKENIVKLLRTTPGRVNIKARTHERVDSVGELRSLSCHVVLTLERAGN